MNPRFSMMRRTEAIDSPTLLTWQRDYYPQLRGASERMLKKSIVLLAMSIAGLVTLALVDGQRQ